MNKNISINSDKKTKKTITIGTHNGLFHCDEVVACALLSMFIQNLYGEEVDINIIRTRDLSILEKCDISVDIGEGKYDHHYTGFNEKRDGENGEMYASAGLVFKYFGRQLIVYIKEDIAREISKSDVAVKENQEIEDMTEGKINSLYKEIDEEIIKPIDMQDNGKQDTAHYFDFIPLFNPSWHEEQSLKNFDKSFERALDLTIQTLKNYFNKKILNKEGIKDEEENSAEELNFQAIVEEYLPIISNNMRATLEDNTDSNEVCKVSPELIDYVESKIEPFISSHDFSIYSEEVKELIIKQKIHKIVDDFYSAPVMKKIINKAQLSQHSILEIPSQTINWEETICQANEQNEKNGKKERIDFVIYPYPNGGYALQCVPKSNSKEDKYTKRISLLKKDKLPDGITKIHPNLFFATGEYDALIKLAEEAIKLEVEKDSKGIEH